MLVLDHIGLKRIAELRARAEAAPMAEADVLARLRQRQSGRELPDPPAMTVALREDYLVAFQIEDWPDGRWRRLTVSTHSSDPRGGLPDLLKEFGFVQRRDADGVSEMIMWNGPQRGGRRSLSVCELIEERGGRGALSLFDQVLDDLTAEAGLQEDEDEEEPEDEC
jgi:hypothetical protein